VSGFQTREVWQSAKATETKACFDLDTDGKAVTAESDWGKAVDGSPGRQCDRPRPTSAVCG